MATKYRSDRVDRVRLEVLGERVTALEKALPELRSDVKTVLSLVTDLKIAMASQPARAEWERLVGEVDKLRLIREEARGGWRVTVALLAFVASLVSSSLTLYLSRLWSD